MRQALVVVGVLALIAGVVVFMIRSNGGGGAGSATPTGNENTSQGESGSRDTTLLPGPDAEALAALREELSRAEPVAFRSDEQRIADARAWVDANHPADRPYNDLEAKMLALMDMIFDGQERSALWTLNMQEIEIEMIRAIDADGDGVVSDDEVAAFANEGLGMFNPMEHPYLKAQLDTDGDGEISPAEMQELASSGMMEGAMAGVIERAQLEKWDTDNDGFVSDDERVAGQEATGPMLKYFADGRVEPVTDPSQIDPAEQELVMVELAEKFGDDYVASLQAQQEVLSPMMVAMPLLQDMRVENMDQQELQAQMMESMPVPPAEDLFDNDGDGTIGSEELEAYTVAIKDYQETIRDWAAVQTANSLRQMFDHATTQSDEDGDGRMSSAEWDDRIDQLMYERQERLFLRSYDLDNSGRVEGDELNQYVEWYRAGSARADINYDGAVDARDLEEMAMKFQQQGR